MKILTSTKREHAAAILLIAAAGMFFVLASGSLMSGFHFMDCHGFITLNQYFAHGDYQSAWQQVRGMATEGNTRFHPLLSIFFFCKAWLLGDNLVLHGLLQVFFCMLAAFFIYSIGRKSQWTHVESLMLSGFTLLGTQSAIFAFTGVVEGMGLAALTASWLCLIKYLQTSTIRRKVLYYGSFVALTAFCCLIKESFIVMLPATYLFYIIQHTKNYRMTFTQVVKHTWKTGALLLFMLLASLGAAAVITSMGSKFSYAGIEYGGILPYLKTLFVCMVLNVNAVLGIVFAILFLRKTPFKQWFYPVLVTAAIVAPQIVIYAKSGIIDRYLIPAALGCAFFSVYIMRMLKQNDATLCGIWRMVLIAAGIVAASLGFFTAFNLDMQNTIAKLAMHTRGSALQSMMSHSTEYIRASLLAISAAMVAVGILMAAQGLVMRKHSVFSASMLYARFLLFILLFQAGIAFASLWRYAMKGHATEDFLNTIINNSHANDAILIVGSVNVEGEGQGAARVYLGKYDRRNVYNCRIHADSAHISWADFYYRGERVDSISGIENIPVIAMFPALEQRFAQHAAWFLPSNYARYDFLGNFVVLVKK